MTDVVPSQVGQVVQDFIDYNHVNQLNVVEQPDGNYTVTPGG
jgi:hypothetical protein